MEEQTKAGFTLEIRYDDAALAAPLKALAEALQSRGHEVTVRQTGAQGIVSEFVRSAKDLNLKTLAGNVRDAAESGVQKIIQGVITQVSKPAVEENPPAAQESAGAAPAFDDIGPAATENPPSGGAPRALLATSPACLKDAPWNEMRIGLMAATQLDQAWQPGQLDAMVIPHPAFRSYLESIHWLPDRIFEGGYPVAASEMPTLSHEDAKARFHLKYEDGPVVVVMATGFSPDEMQALVVQLSLVRAHFQLFFCHGGDARKAESLRALAMRYNVRARMFGHVDHLPDYMAMADLAVAHAGDSNLGVLENAGAPMLIVERYSASAFVDFLVHEKSAVITPQLHSLSSALAGILSGDNLAPMRAAADAIAQYASVTRCADAVEAALRARSAIVPEPEKRIAADDGFEVIGQPFDISAAFAPESVHDAAMIRPKFKENTAGGLFQTFESGAGGSEFPSSAQNMVRPRLPQKTLKQLRDDYAQLILADKSLDKSLAQTREDVRTWELRLDLARQNARDDLAEVATVKLADAKNAERSLMVQKNDIAKQKASLRQMAQENPNEPAGGFGDDDMPEKNDGSSLEAQFRQLQNDEALRELRRKLGKPV